MAQTVSPSLREKSCQAENCILPVSSAMIPENTVLSSPFTVMFLASTETIFPVTVTLPNPSRMSPILHSFATRVVMSRSGTLMDASGAGSTLPRLPRLTWTLSFHILQ